jgi:alpha-L-rhamnosidase
LIDNPTRERGQWAGDVVTVGMEIAGVAFSDLRLCRRGLMQCAGSARKDGLIAGMCPGQEIFLSTYAAQWVTACVHYWELTGDRKLLEDLFPAAEANISAFEQQRTPEGVKDELGWGFVDWGYIRNPGASDMAVNLHYLAALQDMERWCVTLGKKDRAEYYQRIATELRGTLTRYYDTEFKAGGEVWPRIGYHRAALGLRLGFFKDASESACVDFLKAHILSCFPNDPQAPRLSDPAANNPRLITPYFGHFVMPLLIERGEMDFVLDQYRKSWGWALEDGRTTWLEVFDTRWSHCHQWAGCPTWQLSRYALGLQLRQDLGANHFVLALHPGSLEQAEGSIPVPGLDRTIKIKWKRKSDGIHFSARTPVPIVLHIPGKTAGTPGRMVSVKNEFSEVIRP